MACGSGSSSDSPSSSPFPGSGTAALGILGAGDRTGGTSGLSTLRPRKANKTPFPNDLIFMNLTDMIASMDKDVNVST